MKRLFFVMICVCGGLSAVIEQISSDSKCPCSVKPKINKDEVQTIIHEPVIIQAVDDKCGCSVKPKPHKDDVQPTGADLFVSGTQGIMLCVQGGVLAQKEGNIKVALPYIFEGLTILTDLASRSPNPGKSYQELFKFMNSLDKNELDILAKKAIK